MLNRNTDLKSTVEFPGDDQVRGHSALAFLATALRHQARLVVLVVAAGLIMTLIALFCITPRYIASANILVDVQGQKSLGSPASDSKFDVLIEDELEILRSPRIAARILTQLRDGAAAESNSRTSWWWPSFLRGKPKVVRVANATFDDRGHTNDATASASPPMPISQAELDRLMRFADIERKGRSFVVNVAYSDPSAERAAAVANAFVEAYLADQLDAKNAAAKSENQRLKARILELRKDIDEIEQRQQAYRKGQGVIEVGKLTLVQKEISDYAEQLASARARAAEAEVRLNQAHAVSESPQQLLSLEVALQSPVISEYRRQAAEIQRRIADGVSRYGEEHASVASARAELINLNIEIQNEAKRIVESLQLAQAAAVDKVKLLEAGLESMKEKALTYESDQTKLSAFERDLDVSTKLYATLLGRYHETGAANLLSPDARVLSYAVAPPRPTSPKKTLLLMLASVAWLGIGVGLGLLRELTYQALRSRAEAERVLGLPCVSEVPVVDFQLEGRPDGSTRNLCAPIYWKLAEDEGQRFDQAIFGLKQWADSITQKGARTVVVTATHRGEGCSTIAAQLARHATSTGLRAVLVDADFRNLGLTDSVGTEPFEVQREDVAREISPFGPIVTLNDGLAFVPAPQSDCQPLEVLGSRRMGQFLDRLRDNHDLIIIDTSPLATYVDAGALVGHVDAVLFVIKAAQTSQREVLAALSRLDPDPRLPIGVVLNMVDQPSG